MVKGTTSMGAFTKKKVHIRCRRCGNNSFRIPTLSGIIYLPGTYYPPSEKQITSMVGYVSESIGDIHISENSAD